VLNMAKRGGQPGNTCARKGNEWKLALKRALAHRGGKTYREGLDEVATKVVEAACDGDFQAWREIADRMDGKPRQAIDLDVEGEIPLSGTVKVVDSRKD
jgi:hypothetical protein